MFSQPPVKTWGAASVGPSCKSETLQFPLSLWRRVVSVCSRWKLLHFPVKRPFPLKTGLFVSAAISWQIEKQAGRYLRLLCTPACSWHSEIFPLPPSLQDFQGAARCRAHSSWDRQEGRQKKKKKTLCLFYSGPNVLTAPMSSAALRPLTSHTAANLPGLKTARGPMREQELSQQGGDFFNRYTSTWNRFLISVSAEQIKTLQVTQVLLVPGARQRSEAWVLMS